MNPDTLAYIERPAEGAPQGLLLLLHGVGADERSLADLAQKAGIDPRQVLIEADLLPQRIVRHPQSRRRVIVETQPPLTPEQQVQLDKNGNAAQAGGEA